MNIPEITAKMTLEDKISLCTGADFWHSKAMERYGIPAFTMSDGPHGLRFQSGDADMITWDNSCMEMKDSSLVMKIQYKVTERIIAKSFGGKKDYSDPAFKMMMVCATDCPLRASVISSGGTLSDSAARGLVEMANGHFLRGIRVMLGK